VPWPCNFLLCFQGFGMVCVLLASICLWFDLLIGVCKTWSLEPVVLFVA
jgi:hypothetical protein